MSSKKLISFIIPTRRLDFLTTWFDRMEVSVSDPSCLEVLVKLDTDQENAEEYMAREAAKRPFDIKYIITPRIEGQFSIWIAVEQLFFMSNPNSYFIQILSDEPYFVTKNWDQILRNYVGLFPDHIFRLRMSSMKFANYSSHYECTFRPDSFPVYTRKWLTLTLGTGNCWGSDAFQQCVAFQLSLGERSYKNIFRVNSQWRDIPVIDLEIAGLEFGVGIDADVEKYKHKRTLREWKRLTSYAMQKQFSYLASRLYCGIWAYEHNIDEYRIQKNNLKSITQLYDKDNNLRLEVSYDVPIFPVIFQHIYINFYFFKRAFLYFLSEVISPFYKLIYKLVYKLVLWSLDISIGNLDSSKKIKNHAKARLRRLYQWYQMMTNMILKLLIRKRRPPGIKVLSGKSILPPRVNQPTDDDIIWAKQQIQDINLQKKALEDMLISKGQ